MRNRCPLLYYYLLSWGRNSILQLWLRHSKTFLSGVHAMLLLASCAFLWYFATNAVSYPVGNVVFTSKSIDITLMGGTIQEALVGGEQIYAATSYSDGYSIMYPVRCHDTPEQASEMCRKMVYVSRTNEYSEAKAKMGGRFCCVDTQPLLICIATDGGTCYLSDDNGDFPDGGKLIKEKFQTIKFPSKYQNKLFPTPTRFYSGCSSHETAELPVPATAASGVPKLAFLFLAKDKISNDGLWREWLKAGMAWARQNGKDIPFKVYIHFSEDKPQIPEWPETKANIKAVPSAWGNLNPVMLHLLRMAYADDGNNLFAFMFVSDTTIPLKPFKTIYKDLVNNPRSRFSLSNYPSPILTPKHSQWFTLMRPHAEILIQNPGRWVCAEWIKADWYTGNVLLAAPDEYLPLALLLQTIGHTTMQKQMNGGKVAWWCHTSAFYNADATNSFGCKETYDGNIWIIWDLLCHLYGPCIDRNGKGPAKFTGFYSSALKKLVGKKNLWFARKVEDNAPVIGLIKHNPQSLLEWFRKHTDVLR